MMQDIVLRESFFYKGEQSQMIDRLHQEHTDGDTSPVRRRNLHICTWTDCETCSIHRNLKQFCERRACRSFVLFCTLFINAQVMRV